MSRYTIYQADLGASKIKGVVGQDISAGLQQILFQGGGVLDPHHVATMKSEQRVSLASHDIKTVLSSAGINSVDLSVDNLALYLQKRADAGKFVAGASHIKALMAKGILTIDSLSASQDAEASISMSVIPTSDGVNSPIVLSDSNTLPTLSRETERYTLGPCTINGTAVSLQSFSMNFGVTVDAFGTDGFPFNTFASIVSRSPKITLQTFDNSKALAYDLFGQASAGDLIVYLTKLKAGGTRVPNATAEHIKITISDYQINTDSYSDSASIVVTPDFDGSNDIAIIEVDQAIA